jgi:small conductance mechanosensitive channel
VSKYGDNAIEYTLRVWTATESYWDTYFDVLENVKKVFDARGIAMTYPHVNVHMVQE